MRSEAAWRVRMFFPRLSVRMFPSRSFTRVQRKEFSRIFPRVRSEAEVTKDSPKA